jgi:TonB family protein
VWAGAQCLISIAGAGMVPLPLDVGETPPRGLPPLSRYQAPEFPSTLRITSVTDGYATMLFTIDASGEVEDSVAIAASHPAFVAAVREALANWRFKPAESATDPRRELIQFQFKRTGMIGSLNQREATEGFFPHDDAWPAIRTVEWEDLQSTPERIVASMPAYPQALRAQPVRGYASVSFVIDAEGEVRVPVIIEASEPEFGNAALAAVKRWRFAPPVQDDHPVNVTVTRSFRFGK